MGFRYHDRIQRGVLVCRYFSEQENFMLLDIQIPGGQGTWREFLTLPNILKEFNPNLTGYSTGTGEFLSPHSQLNVAFPVSADADALKEAKVLVNRMKKDKRINIKEDWKMITLFFGANDICSAQCYDKWGSTARMHLKKLMVALDYLQSKLPRTFVNLIPVLGN